MEDYEKRIAERGIHVTAIRLLVFKAMTSHPHAFSLADLEEKLDSVDKSTLSRTIHLFHRKRLIHSIDDGSGSTKYSVCSSHCHCVLNDLHVHFYCKRCKHTFCMKSIAVPQVLLPPGFHPEESNYVLKGYCNACSKNT